MRFAEKMLLNAKYYPLIAGFRHKHGGRCALGLVEEGKITDFGKFGNAQRNAEELFPWLRFVHTSYPCACDFLRTIDNNVVPIIAHLFNDHVMGDWILVKRDWTLERLADWIDSVDPTPREEVKEVDEDLLMCELEPVQN